MPWPHQKPTRTNSSLQMETKQLQREHINKENFLKPFIKLSNFWQKTFSKLRIGIVENLLAAMPNPKQPERKGSPASVWP